MNTTKFAKTVAQHLGTITAQDDKGLVRVEFPNYPRAAGFYDDVQSWGLQSEIVNTVSTVVIVQL